MTFGLIWKNMLHRNCWHPRKPENFRIIGEKDNPGCILISIQMEHVDADAGDKSCLRNQLWRQEVIEVGHDDQKRGFLGNLRTYRRHLQDRWEWNQWRTILSCSRHWQHRSYSYSGRNDRCWWSSVARDQGSKCQLHLSSAGHHTIRSRPVHLYSVPTGKLRCWSPETTPRAHPEQ